MIRGGEWDSQTETEFYKAQDRNVMKIIEHSKFNAGNGQNNVALIIVTEPFLVNEVVSTLCLPSQNFEFNEERCFTSGWGKHVTGKYCS